MRYFIICVSFLFIVCFVSTALAVTTPKSSLVLKWGVDAWHVGTGVQDRIADELSTAQTYTAVTHAASSIYDALPGPNTASNLRIAIRAGTGIVIHTEHGAGSNGGVGCESYLYTPAGEVAASNQCLAYVVNNGNNYRYGDTNMEPGVTYDTVGFTGPDGIPYIFYRIIALPGLVQKWNREFYKYGPQGLGFIVGCGASANTPEHLRQCWDRNTVFAYDRTITNNDAETDYRALLQLMTNPNTIDFRVAADAFLNYHESSDLPPYVLMGGYGAISLWPYISFTSPTQGATYVGAFDIIRGEGVSITVIIDFSANMYHPQTTAGTYDASSFVEVNNAIPDPYLPIYPYINPLPYRVTVYNDADHDVRYFNRIGLTMHVEDHDTVTVVVHGDMLKASVPKGGGEIKLNADGKGPNGGDFVLSFTPRP